MSNLTNAVTIVTGASSGDGAATAKRLAVAGAKVVLAARNEDKMRALTSEKRRLGGRRRTGSMWREGATASIG